MNTKSCACCGEKTISQICNVCGWEDDEVQNSDPDYAVGSNHISLNTAKKAWKEGKRLELLMKEAWDQFIEKEKIKST
ncbi:hypothetical protein FACS189450_09190 [Spirochaetia bacterium]|nr:hypothetical protein FACS189450_09190 [Spirochaetia bacterium]